MTKKMQKQCDQGMTCSHQYGGDTLKVTLLENVISQRGMPLPSLARVTQGNHFSKNRGSNTKAAGVQTQMESGEIEPILKSGHPRYPGHPVEVEVSPLQPPVIWTNLRESVKRLVHEATATTSIASNTQAATGSIEDVYVTRITKWAQCLTPAQLGRCFSIEEVMALAGLKGRYRAHASVRYTAEALRRCGFKQKRDWTVAGRNKRFWMKGD